MATYHHRLRALIDTEPLNAAKTDAEVIVWLEEPSGAFADSRYSVVEMIEKIGLPKTEELFAAIDAAAAQADPRAPEFALLKLAWAQSADGVDIGNPRVRASLNRLVAVGVIGQPEINLVLGLSASKNRAIDFGLRWPSNLDQLSKLTHVADARAL